MVFDTSEDIKRSSKKVSTSHKSTIQDNIDEDILKKEYFGCHPCVNTSSLKFKTTDLMERIIPALGHTPKMVRLG